MVKVRLVGFWGAAAVLAGALSTDGCYRSWEPLGEGGASGSATGGRDAGAGTGAAAAGSGNDGGEGPADGGRPSTGGSGGMPTDPCSEPEPPPGGRGGNAGTAGGGGEGNLGGVGGEGNAGGASALAAESCEPNPCEHGALCIEEAEGGVSCVCPPGYGGSRCEHALRSCCGPNSSGIDPVQCRRAQIGAGNEHTCHLGTNGSVTCWGGDRYHAFYYYDGASSPPAYAFEQLSINGGSCAIDKWGGIACWGLGRSEYVFEVNAPDGAFNGVSLGTDELCALDKDWAVDCVRWGRPQVPSGNRYFGLSSGLEFSCAINQLREIECFPGGRPPRGITEPPSGRFFQVSAGVRHACGVRVDHTLACWGENAWEQATPPTGSFRQVSSGTRHSCGVRENGRLACWGDAPYTGAPSGTFVEVSASDHHTCAIRSDGKVACWGEDRLFQLHPPLELSAEPEAFVALAVGGTTTYQEIELAEDLAGAAYGCGLDAEGALSCWGEPLGTPPSGTFRQVSVGYGSACAIRIDGALACWGNIVVEPPSQSPPAARYEQVSAGYTLACAVRTTGALDCWQFDVGAHTPDAIPPSTETFTQVSVVSDMNYREDEFVTFKRHACALTVDGRAVCFGGRSRNIEGPFVHVSAGADKDCALDADGRAWCWRGVSAAPVLLEGEFTKIGLGDGGLAGLRPNGRLAWERPPLGEESPTDRFIDLSVAGDFACALRADGKQRCFGALER